MNEKDEESNSNEDIICKGFETQSAVSRLGEIVSFKKLRAALKRIGFAPEEILNLLPNDPLRLVDSINQADFLYPHSNKEVHQASQKVIGEVQNKVALIEAQMLVKNGIKQEYDIVGLGSGPLMPFYLEVASEIKGCSITEDSTLLIKNNSWQGTFNLKSDLHLLQPGPLRKEPFQFFNLPIPSSLVELGVLNLPVSWTNEDFHFEPLENGKIKICLEPSKKEITTDTVILSLGLGESKKVIKGHQSKVTSIFAITNDGGVHLRKLLRKNQGEDFHINIVGSGGAVASALHVVNRVASELKHEGFDFKITVNLWTNLSYSSLENNEKLAYHVAWMKNELLNLKLKVSDPSLMLGKDPIKVGEFELTHLSNNDFVLYGNLFHFDPQTTILQVDEANNFLLIKDNQPQTHVVMKNTLAINCGGQANFKAAIELKQFLGKLTSSQSLNPVLLGDDEGLHTLVLELKSKNEIKSRLILGTTQAIGILRAWTENPLLIPECENGLTQLLIHLEKGHEKASKLRHSYAYYSIKKTVSSYYEIEGGYSQEKPENVGFLVPLPMPGAVGVCHTRKIQVFKSGISKI